MSRDYIDDPQEDMAWSLRRIADALSAIVESHGQSGFMCTCGDVFPDAASFDDHYIGIHHDCFWDGQAVKPREPQDIASLRMDVTDEEAAAFMDAIGEAER